MMDRKLLLLGLLRAQEMHGYQLYDFLERYLSTCTDIKKPTAYYLLNKMAQDGWLEEQQIQNGNRPARKVYHLTVQGETQFQRLLRQNLTKLTPSEFAGAAAIAFIEVLQPHEALALLEKRHAAMRQILKELQTAPKHQGSMNIMIEYQLQRFNFELEWLSGLIDRFHHMNFDDHLRSERGEE